MSKEENIEELKLKSKGKGGSWLYGFILMATGVFLIILGMLDLLGYSYVYNFLVTNGLSDVAIMMSIGGIMNFVVGMFAVVGGFGLIIDQEWAWGMSMLVLTYTIVLSIKNIIESNLSLGVNPSDTNSVAVLWVSVIVTIVSIAGLAYLGLTKHKYA
ncbi:MAG TPA: hypothetical protein VMV49_09975 [Candidatus Deferrimicrobium sp.]|nr:hypothetical protein [Candidatus Deferrimicrobium sp.]